MADLEHLDSGRFFVTQQPSNLIEGQNFFDQWPFESYVQHAFDSTGIAIKELKWLLNGFGSNHQTRDQREVYTKIDVTPAVRKMWGAQTPMYVDSGLKALFKRLATSFSIPEDQVGYHTKAGYDLVFSLREFPYWIQYVGSQQDSAFYLPDGTYRRRQENAIYPNIETYAGWVSGKIRREHNAILVGMEDVVEDMKKGPVRGKSRTGSWYALLKASELISGR